MGADGQGLLQAIEAAGEQPWWRESSTIQTLRRGWAAPDVEGHGPLSWREGKDRPSPAERLAAP